MAGEEGVNMSSNVLLRRRGSEVGAGNLMSDCPFLPAFFFPPTTAAILLG